MSKKKLTDKQRITKLEKQLKVKEKQLKVKGKQVIKYKAKSLTYEALQLRKRGMTWVKIGKKLKVPESSMRLATQKRYTQPFLRGRWSKDKLSVSERIDYNTREFLKAQGQPHLKADVMDYIRSHRS